MKKVFERIIEGILTCSGFVTSITILLIVLFLFTEAFGLFSSKVIEEGYVLALNKDNKVSELTPMQIKDVFDEEITNWKELGGEDLPIRVFRLEDITHYYSEEELGEAYENAGEKIMELIQKTPGIVAFIPHHFCEGGLCRSGMVSDGYSRTFVRLSAADNRYALGEPVCHIDCFAVRTFGIDLYVRGGRFESTWLAEAGDRVAERYSFGGIWLFRLDRDCTFDSESI